LPVIAMEFSPFVIVSSEAIVASRGAMILNLSATPFASRIGLHVLDQLGVMGAGFVEPEDRFAALRPSACRSPGAPSR
jgi:hypothetical protein